MGTISIHIQNPNGYYIEIRDSNITGNTAEEAVLSAIRTLTNFLDNEELPIRGECNLAICKCDKSVADSTGHCGKCGEYVKR